MSAKRCSRCGKKKNLMKDKTIPSHKAFRLLSQVQHVSNPSEDEAVVTKQCPGSNEPPHKGRWFGTVGRTF